MVEIAAPAKINLTLHVTGKREDGYHLLDSLVMFADFGDRVTVEPSETTTLKVTGPMSAGVPEDATNLVVRAATMMGSTGAIKLDKHLPNAAGLGGGSSDAAATMKALSMLTGKPMPSETTSLGADIPVCLAGVPSRMRGVGEDIRPLPGLPELHALLVNPNLPVMTADVFRRLKNSENAPMPSEIPEGLSPKKFARWLAKQRNDLEMPAIEAEPVIAQVFHALSVTPGCRLARMSGSGATCFGLYANSETARAAEGRLRETHPGWWTKAVVLRGS